MNKLTILLITTLSCSVAAESAHADRERGFMRFLNAVSQAAEAAQSRRNGGYQEQGYQDQGYYQEEAAYQDAGYEEWGPMIVDLRGDWVMNDGNINRFRKTHNGYYVAPVGRGKGVHYIEIGEHLYQDANSTGTYEVVSDDYMIWSSNNGRNQNIELYRR